MPWARSSIYSKYMSSWWLFLNPHLTTPFKFRCLFKMSNQIRPAYLTQVLTLNSTCVSIYLPIYVYSSFSLLVSGYYCYSTHFLWCLHPVCLSWLRHLWDFWEEVARCQSQLEQHHIWYLRFVQVHWCSHWHECSRVSPSFSATLKYVWSKFRRCQYSHLPFVRVVLIEPEVKFYFANLQPFCKFCISYDLLGYYLWILGGLIHALV
jgi:hypothetical protein